MQAVTRHPDCNVCAKFAQWLHIIPTFSNRSSISPFRNRNRWHLLSWEAWNGNQYRIADVTGRWRHDLRNAAIVENRWILAVERAAADNQLGRSMHQFIAARWAFRFRSQTFQLSMGQVGAELNEIVNLLSRAPPTIYNRIAAAIERIDSAQRRLDREVDDLYGITTTMSARLLGPRAYADAVLHYKLLNASERSKKEDYLKGGELRRLYKKQLPFRGQNLKERMLFFSAARQTVMEETTGMRLTKRLYYERVLQLDRDPVHWITYGFVKVMYKHRYDFNKSLRELYNATKFFPLSADRKGFNRAREKAFILFREKLDSATYDLTVPGGWTNELVDLNTLITEYQWLQEYRVYHLPNSISPAEIVLARKAYFTLAENCNDLDEWFRTRERWLRKPLAPTARDSTLKYW